MVEGRAERRLAAILAADVVGYSRLIRSDEEGTLGRLKALRGELVGPKIADYRGRIVKFMGDGILAEFGSVVDAVHAATELQRAMTERNAGLRADERIEFRIGVNLGDVVIDGDDIHGDGVNIAARLEGLARPSGVCISGAAYDQVRDRIDLPFEDLGDQEVKNIDRPVRVWHWNADAEPGERSPSESLTLPDKPSIAVLPFDDMSGETEQQHFADGIAEDITTGLSCIRSFFVIARNSSFTYRGSSVDVSKVGRELGVRYVLEGSVRRAGKRIRVTAQLVDAPSRKHIWAQRFDRDLDDIFAVQDEITSAIVGAIGPEVDGAERARALRRPTERLDAWSAYQRGLWHAYRYSREGTVEAADFFHRAVALDPSFAAAHAGLSFVHYLNALLDYAGSREDEIDKAFECAKQSILLDDKDAMSYWSLGRAHRLRGEYDLAITSFKTALELNPSYAHAHYNLGWTLVLAGETEQGAIAALDQALRLSPRDPLLHTFMCVRATACYVLGLDEEAHRWAENAVQQSNAHAHVKAFYTFTLERVGRHAEAVRSAEALLRERPDYRCDLFRKGFPFRRSEDIDTIIEGMRKAGLPE